MKFTKILTGLKKNSLSELHLHPKSLGKRQCTQLAQAFCQNTSLRTFILNCYNIDSANMINLIQLLTRHRHLHTLDYSGCLNDNLAVILTHCLRMNSTLGYLKLTDNALTAASLPAISYLFAHQAHLAIHTLDLSLNQFMANSGWLLAQLVINNDKLKVLSLNYNPLADEGIASLACGLFYNYSLHTLDLQGTHIGESGAMALGFLLKNQQSLVKLNLRDNVISDFGAACLAEGLSINTGLLKLNLDNNKITAVGAQMIGQALCSNNHLICLGLEDNQINNAGLLALAQMLMVNPSLLYLNLTDNPITEACAAFFTQRLIDSHILCRLSLYHENLPPTFFELLEQLQKRDESKPSAVGYSTLYSQAVEKHINQWSWLQQQCAYLLKAARLLIQARHSPQSPLQQIPIELQEHIVSRLEQQPLTAWQRRNIWQYAHEKPQHGNTRHHFLRYTFFNNKPIEPLQILADLRTTAII